MADEVFSKTARAIANRVTEITGRPCDQSTVSDYADWGLIEFLRLDNRIKLFKPSVAKEVAKIREKRLARRGRYARTRPAVAPP